ncbi:putative glycoprotein [Blechmonas luni leishbunyavirus 1]|uniref:Putative glycoprotein n=1 Tax=Blechmonas luni leishbunyavirus 1 TaxID=2364198 RepID=A0A386IS93_9VIRU|nr:putative glycoprotein [Blechmonas luni leishbunyavirus 1]
MWPILNYYIAIGGVLLVTILISGEVCVDEVKLENCKAELETPDISAIDKAGLALGTGGLLLTAIQFYLSYWTIGTLPSETTLQALADRLREVAREPIESAVEDFISQNVQLTPAINSDTIFRLGSWALAKSKLRNFLLDIAGLTTAATGTGLAIASIIKNSSPISTDHCASENSYNVIRPNIIIAGDWRASIVLRNSTLPFSAKNGCVRMTVNSGDIARLECNSMNQNYVDYATSGEIHRCSSFSLNCKYSYVVSSVKAFPQTVYIGHLISIRYRSWPFYPEVNWCNYSSYTDLEVVLGPQIISRRVIPFFNRSHHLAV